MLEEPAAISFTDHRQIGVLQHRLGRIGAAALANAPAPVNHPELTLVHARTPVRHRFPCGAETRTIDRSARIKLHLPTGPLSSVLGWDLGALDAVTVDWWLVLTAPAGFAGAHRDRCGVNARFTAQGGANERITLRPAQPECLDAAKGDTVLVVAIPDAHALILVNPAVWLAVAPGHISALVDPSGTHQ